MAYYFCAKLSEGGRTYLHDIECQLDCRIDDDEGTSEPYLVVDDVLIDGLPMPRPWRANGYRNSLAQMVAAEIIRQAEADDDLFRRVAEDAGLTFVGHPADPSSHWRQAAE